MSIPTTNYLAERTAAYVRQVRRYYAAAEGETLAALHDSMSRICTECGQRALAVRGDGQHETIDDPFGEPWVIVGCEGYWLVDPALVGMDRGAWQDWRGDRCDACAAPMGEHCNECQECPWTEGPCWCGAWSYTAHAVERARAFRDGLDEYSRDETAAAAAGIKHPTADERREAAVRALVSETMAVPEGQRYSRAYGVLAGLVLSVEAHSLPWARAYVAALDEAMRTGLARSRDEHAARIAAL